MNHLSKQRRGRADFKLKASCLNACLCVRKSNLILTSILASLFMLVIGVRIDLVSAEQANFDQYLNESHASPVKTGFFVGDTKSSSVFGSRNLSQGSLLPERKGVANDLLMPSSPQIKNPKISLPETQKESVSSTSENSGSKEVDESTEQVVSTDEEASNGSIRDKQELLKSIRSNGSSDMQDILRHSRQIRKAIFGTESDAINPPVLRTGASSNKQVKESTRF